MSFAECKLIFAHKKADIKKIFWHIESIMDNDNDS